MERRHRLRVLGVRLGLALALLLRAADARTAEPLAFVDLEGGSVTVAAPAPGAALVVHYWATWCPSCERELSELDRAAATCRGTEVEVLAVDVGESADTVRRFLAERPLSLRVLLDPKGRTWRESGGREMPANLIWTAGGQSWALGPSREAQWRERLGALGCTRGAAATPRFLE